MARAWTDHDDTTWEVEIYEGESVDESPVEERWIEFRPTVGKPAIVAPCFLEKPGEELCAAELQKLVNHAKRGAGMK